MESHREDDGHTRELITWSEKRQMWRWFLGIGGGKALAGWEASKPKALLAIALAKNPDPVAHITRGPRSPTGFEPPVS